MQLQSSQTTPRAELEIEPPRDDFCAYLRERREACGMPLGEIARITRIPKRSLEHLEGGRFESLPADVFVRGFVRSYARCVGLDADEAIRRYAACGLEPAPVASEDAKAFYGRVARADRPRPAAAPEPAERERGARPGESAEVQVRPGDAQAKAAAAASAASEQAATPRGVTGSTCAGPAASGPAAPGRSSGQRPAEARRRASAATRRRRRRRRLAARRETATAGRETAAREAAARRESEAREAAARRESEAREAAAREETPRAAPRPVLVIDDACPERAVRSRSGSTSANKPEDSLRAFFLPVISEDEGSRRGALTLAVIILVIVATLTMSVLLRRPSTSSDGVTRAADATTARAV